MTLKKPFKISLIACIFLAGITPQIAFAAWWNPFSWFSFNTQKTEKKFEVQVPVVVQSTSTEFLVKRVNTISSTTIQKRKSDIDVAKKAEEARQARLRADAIVQARMEAQRVEAQRLENEKIELQRRVEEQRLSEARESELRAKKLRIAEENARNAPKPVPREIPLPIKYPEPIPQYLIKEKSITIFTPSGGEVFYVGLNEYPETRADGSYPRIRQTRYGDVIPYTWKWTGPVDNLSPRIYFYNIDRGEDLKEEFNVNSANNFDVSKGETTRFKYCLPNGFGCPAGFTPGRYRLRLCEFSEDKNPRNNALYPVGQTPLCSTSAEFRIEIPATTTPIQ